MSTIARKITIGSRWRCIKKPSDRFNQKMTIISEHEIKWDGDLDTAYYNELGVLTNFTPCDEEIIDKLLEKYK